MKINIQDLKKLDKDLIDLENKFKKKLDKYYSKLESDSLKQVSRYKKTGKLKLADSRQQGLEKLLKGYFTDIEKVSVKHTKNELYRDFKDKDKQQKIADIRISKRSEYNLKYAEKLAEKQIKDFDEKIKKSLDKTLKENSKASVSDLKQTLKHNSKSFKNTRSSTTALTESRRITSDVRESIYNDFDETALVVFTAVLDNRTSDICLSKDGTVIRLNDPLISEFRVPQHVNCRSSWRYLKKPEKPTSKRKLKKEIKENPPIKNKLL